VIKKYTDEKFVGPRAAKRPDLFLAQNVLNRRLLIEFKRPSHTLVRTDENQAEEYRDDLTPTFGDMDILVVGGKVDPLAGQRNAPNLKMLSYAAVFSAARAQSDWLVKELRTEPS
jgi:hypothetical protein